MGPTRINSRKRSSSPQPEENGSREKKRRTHRANGKIHKISNGNGVHSGDDDDNDALIHSPDSAHPANVICELCRKFYTFGWVTGTGGGVSIREGKHVFIAPSGVQKELLSPKDMFVMDYEHRTYLRKPLVGSLFATCPFRFFFSFIILAKVMKATVADGGEVRSTNHRHARRSSSPRSRSATPCAASTRTASGLC